MGLLATGAAALAAGLVLGRWTAGRRPFRRGYADGFEQGRREGRGPAQDFDRWEDPNWTAFDES